MIFDCFMFFNELELLEVRLNELNDVVDKFVLVEATRTFTNKPKKLYYHENREYFKKFNHKIIHVIVDDSPDCDNPWVLDKYQKDCIGRGLKDARPNDLILMSDADEIPKAQTVKKISEQLEYDEKFFTKIKHGILKSPIVRKLFKRLLRKHHPYVYVFEQKLYYYYLNLSAESKWYGTRLLFYRDFTMADEIRYTGYKIIRDGGWHFTYMGGVERIQQKIQSFAHKELNRPEFLNNIHQLIKDKKIVGASDESLSIVQVDENFPQYIRQNLQKYKDWLLAEK